MEILAEGGIEALTIPRLAKRMDASVGGLYRYFPSKEAILVALQKRAIDVFGALQADALRQVEALSSESPEGIVHLARAIASLDILLHLVHQAPIEHALIDAFLSAPTPSLSDDAARLIDAHLAPLLEVCRETFEAASAWGVLDDSDAKVKTHLMWAALHGLSHFRKRDRIQPPALQVDALQAPLIRTLLMGWGARPEDVDAAMRLRARAQTP